MTGRVLVVDDIPQNVKLLEAKLSAEYYTVFTAVNGKDALVRVEECQPDIVLLDVMMPEMDGFEACERIKSDPETAYIPVVMVTALSEQTDRVRGLEAGANDFLTKPIDEVHLFARVKSLVRYKTVLDELRMRDKTGEELGVLETPSINADEKITGKIILVDDDVVQSKKMQKILSEQGHVVEVKEPKEVMDMAVDAYLDLIIVSTMLDGEDGLRLAMNIRSQRAGRQVPILILIDEDDKQMLVKGLEIGIDDYLMTPMDPNELTARVLTQIKAKKYLDRLKATYEAGLSAAVVDSLTKLYNRRYLDAHLGNMVDEALAKKTPLSIIVIDIDHFKQVNDKPGWGHHIGDEVLVQVAERIKSSVRGTDLCTRPGGEEFVAVLPKTELAVAEKVAERVRAYMSERPFTISAEPFMVECTVSIGVSELRLGGDMALDLLKRADEALYEAKQGGRNRVCTRR